MSTLPRSPQITLTQSPRLPTHTHSPRSPALHAFPATRNPHDNTHDDPPLFPDEEDEIPYPEPSSEQTLLPPAHFNPFFTLIEDGTSGEHYHPYVHYVFADDDPVIVTAAAMRSLGLDETRFLPASTPDAEEQGHEELHGEDEGEGEGREGEHSEVVESPLPPPIPGSKQRYVLIDIAADGHTLLSAQSLASDWQITCTNIRPAPTFDEDPGNLGHMLMIEGVEIPRRSNKGKAKGEPGEQKLREARERANGDVFSALDELVKGVEGGLEVACKIKVVPEDVRASERTVLEGGTGAEDEKGKRRANEI